MNQLAINERLGMKGYFTKIQAFRGIRVETVDPLRPDLVDDEAAPIQVLEFPGSRRDLLDPNQEHPNKLLTAGLNVLATQSGWMSYCQVGSGLNQPLASDTALQTHVAGTSTIQDDNYGAQASVPYFGWRRRTYRFAQGVAAGNLNEVGIGWATSGAALICRHRTVNTDNEETTITVLSDEYLDVTYELRYYPPLVDVAGTITLDGTVYDTITRASQVTSAAEWGERIGDLMGQYSNSSSDWNAWDGEIGTITQAPSGTSVACDNANQANETYQNNSFEIVMVCNTGPSGWNVSGGIRSIRIKSTAGNYQTRFGAQGGGDEKIPKNSSYTMQLKWTLSWAELLAVFGVTGTYSVTGSSATLTHNT
jgi:hypothetical protein